MDPDRLMQYPGNSTITFNFPGVTPDRLNNVPSVASSSFTQVGCAMQPVTVKDDLDNTVYSYATDKCIAPPTTNTESVTAEWYLSFNDASFRVLGAKPVYDRWSRLHHITFYCKSEDG